MKIIAFFKIPTNYILDSKEESKILKTLLNELGFKCSLSTYNNYYAVNILVDNKQQASEVFDFINTLKHSPINNNICDTKYVEIDIELDDKSLCDIKELKMMFMQSSIESLQTQIDISNYYQFSEFNNCDEVIKKINDNTNALMATMEKNGIFYYKDTIILLINVLEKMSKINLNELKKEIFKLEH